MPLNLPLGLTIEDLRENLVRLLFVDDEKARVRAGEADALLVASLEYGSAALATEDEAERAFIEKVMFRAGPASVLSASARIDALVAQGTPPTGV